MLDYSNITTILCKPLTYDYRQYEYGINSTECSHYASREDIFTIIHDIMPANRRRLIDLLEVSAPFIAIIPTYDIKELKVKELTKEEVNKLIQEVKDKSVENNLNNLSSNVSRDDKIKNITKDIALKTMFNDKGDYVG